jgi:hypothetical protein
MNSSKTGPRRAGAVGLTVTGELFEEHDLDD